MLPLSKASPFPSKLTTIVVSFHSAGITLSTLIYYDLLQFTYDLLGQ